MKTVANRVSFKGDQKQRLVELQQHLSEDALPGVAWMGYGYDIFGNYADDESATFPLFDWSKVDTASVTIEGKVYRYPKVLDVTTDQSADVFTITGETISSYQTNLATSTSVSGSYNYFSGSLEVDFSSQSLVKSENSFSRVQQTVKLWALRLNPARSLRQYARPDFLAALDGADTDAKRDALFDQYGSHFLSAIEMGGRAVLSSSTNKLTVDRSYSIGVTAEASYKSLVGQLDVKDQTKYSNSIDSFNSTSESRRSVKGGDGVKALSAFDGKKGFSEWKESVKDLPAFIDFVSKNPLAGIWVLCETDDKASKLEDYFFQTWGLKQSKLNQLYCDYIDALTVIDGDSSSIAPPTGYTKVPYDLNTGVKGQFIYLCFHKSSYSPYGGNKPAVVDITAVYNDEMPPVGYTKINVDVTKGAGGDFIYLCYKLDDYKPETSVKDVTAYGSASPDTDPPYGFQRATGDLNRGAGGPFVYVCLSKLG
ncbi:MACPF domain-containing protein [Paraburkholderia sp. D15]|uniref:MAC/perforin domain-containing protein n=1 Tax=Paraburkholderia sp. D15 TaxID=2880218 RepID=UPI00247AA1EB|nr:MAC/perforin domain-containing protein [Paraburkholderia sp. D15]WGS51225.1 MACPF domain-containing protein [Paraburkholderia sp. D15]